MTDGERDRERYDLIEALSWSVVPPGDPDWQDRVRLEIWLSALTLEQLRELADVARRLGLKLDPRRLLPTGA